MNIIKLMTNLRMIFTQLEVPEMLAFPASLHENWCHPDLYLSIKGSGVGSFFVFQHLTRKEGFLFSSTIKTPDMIWLVKPNNGKNVFMEITKNFFQRLENEFKKDGYNGVFYFESGYSKKMNKGERGTYWKIFYEGIRCGRISIYSELPGIEKIQSGAVIVTLQLNKIATVLSQGKFSESAPWVADLSASSSMAMQAWHQLDEESALFSPIMSDFDLSEMDSDSDCIKKLCSLFKIYNLFASSINADNDLYNEFSHRLHILSKRIISYLGETKYINQKVLSNV